MCKANWHKSRGRGDVTKRAIIDVNSIVSGWNYDILFILIITKLMMSFVVIRQLEPIFCFVILWFNASATARVISIIKAVKW